MEQGEFEVLLEVGQAYLLSKDYDKAITKFSEALRINPHDPETYYYLGLAYEGAEKYAEAAQTYEKTLKIDRGHGNAEIRLNEVQKKIAEAKKKKK
ncbi:MAG: tetratricopeptide repeat protein [candidate division WOR-3 bacterium]|nr:MAG: tetratricopeptide repeat protein [candidate division WOR-3 bacterium]